MLGRPRHALGVVVGWSKQPRNFSGNSSKTRLRASSEFKPHMHVRHCLAAMTETYWNCIKSWNLHFCPWLEAWSFRPGHPNGRYTMLLDALQERHRRAHADSIPSFWRAYGLLQLHDLRNCCVTPLFQQIFWWSIQVKHQGENRASVLMFKKKTLFSP